MKYLKYTFVLTAFLALAFTFASCGNQTTKASATEGTEQQGKEHTSAYVCPMHCEGSGSTEAGKCPVCGMDYVVNENHSADGHSH